MLSHFCLCPRCDHLPAIMRPLAGYPVAVGVLATIALGILFPLARDLGLVRQTRYPIEYFGRRPTFVAGRTTISGIDALIVVAAALALVCIPWLCNASGRDRNARRRRESAARCGSAASTFISSTRNPGGGGPDRGAGRRPLRAESAPWSRYLVWGLAGFARP